MLTKRSRYNKMTCESCGEYKDLRFFSKSTRKSGMNVSYYFHNMSYWCHR